MNGARSLIRGLVANDVTVCFANPGTSEMHFVAALDAVPEMRAVLCLYEGAVTGAADGYGRMARRPAATLLHLGPGLGNGLANLHNARRAFTPIVNVVGDHATYHRPLDAPLASDIPAIAGAVSVWTRDCTATGDIAKDVAEAVGAASGAPSGVATLILPADASWSEGGAEPVVAAAPVEPPAFDLAAVADVLGPKSVILLGGNGLLADGVHAAGRIAAATGATVFAETFPARLTRGAGLPVIERLAYLAEAVEQQLQGFEHLVLIGAKAPVSFFAYPGKASELTPDDTAVHTLTAEASHAAAAVTALADHVAAGVEPALAEPNRPTLPTGELTVQTFNDVIGAVLPEDVVISDEANTTGFFLPASTAGAPRHDVLTLTGGAIGQGLAVAVGAAVACPDRPVLCLESDGSAMYGPAALWTMAREQLDVTTVVISNRAYAILRLELGRVGAEEGGEKATRLLDLSSPDLDFVALAQGMGIPARRARTAEELAEALRQAFAEPGPHLIDAAVAPLV